MSDLELNNEKDLSWWSVFVLAITAFAGVVIIAFLRIENVDLEKENKKLKEQVIELTGELTKELIR